MLLLDINLSLLFFTEADVLQCACEGGGGVGGGGL